MPTGGVDWNVDSLVYNPLWATAPPTFYRSHSVCQSSFEWWSPSSFYPLCARVSASFPSHSRAWYPHGFWSKKSLHFSQALNEKTQVFFKAVLHFGFHHQENLIWWQPTGSHLAAAYSSLSSVVVTFYITGDLNGQFDVFSRYQPDVSIQFQCFNTVSSSAS